MDEKSLIRSCQKGDRQAFETLIRRYYDYVTGFLLKMTEDKALSEDLTQETFLKMIRNIERFDPGGSAAFGTWLITIAKNCFLDHLRRSRIRFEDWEELSLADPRDIASEVEQKISYEELLAATASLPPEQGLAIRLKYVEDMTLQEIAERLGIPSKTVKSRIHEGTVKLRRMLQKNSPERRDE